MAGGGPASSDGERTTNQRTASFSHLHSHPDEQNERGTKDKETQR